MSNYAFIFARGGSKGLPRKNIKLLAGKPLIQYSIDVALASPSIDRVFVSTDDMEISRVAKDLGATVINRPAELASDDSPEWLSWRHAINWTIDNYGGFSGFVSLPATSPLRGVEDVEAAIAKRYHANADICISVTPANRSPYFNMVTINAAGNVELVKSPESEVSRRQDAPEIFDVTTVVYTATPKFILESYGVFSGKVTSICVPKERAVDIDDIYDFTFAEAIVKAGV